jgi:hypothetical protein
MMVAMEAHSGDKQAHMIYHVTLSLHNPALSAHVVESMHRYFFDNPQCHGRNGKHVCLKNTSGKRAFGLDPLVPASIWAGTKGPAMSPQNRQATHKALVPARNEPLVPV